MICGAPRNPVEARHVHVYEGYATTALMNFGELRMRWYEARAKLVVHSNDRGISAIL